MTPPLESASSPVAPDRPVTPPLPARVLDPRPALAAGTAAWAVGLAATLVFHGPGRSVVLCAVGVVVGALGYGVYALQRRAVLRGSAGAQQGLDIDQRSGSGSDAHTG